LRTPRSPRLRRKSSNVSRPPPSPGFRENAGDGEQEDDFGDDFDDFEEGNEDDDFGEFDEGDFDEQSQETSPPPPQPQLSAAPPQPSLSYPIPDFTDLDPDDIQSLTEPYLDALFPPDDAPPTLPPLSKSDNPIFLTPRSASLWSQLVAPPPLQPPDWIRSRIRRLFLVSLGVPVDLDEILPASKQKKLVLPSLHRVTSTGSLRSASSRSRSLSRLKKRDDGNASSTSVDTQGKPKPKSSGSKKRGKGDEAGRRKGPSEPELDLVAAKQLCTTTDEALDGMTDGELRAHVKRLAELEETAKEALDFWTKRTDEKIGDREAFEGVIENLVKHARKVRQ